MPVSVVSQPFSIWLMARPLSVQSVLGNRYTRTSVNPFRTARWMIVDASLTFSSSLLPDGLLRRSISARFSASTATARRTYSSAFSASLRAASLRMCVALGMRSSMPGMTDGSCCSLRRFAQGRSGPGRSLDSNQANRGPGRHSPCRSLNGAILWPGEKVERAASPDGTASSAFLSRPRRWGRYADGDHGPLPDRHRALGRYALLAPAQPARADGAQIAKAAIRVCGRARPDLALHAYAYFLDRGIVAGLDRPSRFRDAAAQHCRFCREDRRRDAGGERS